jgi:antitoxin CptB
MSLKDKKFLKKLLYQSSHRGCKETDLLLGNFAEKYLATLSSDSLKSYEIILNEADYDIVSWIMKKTNPPIHVDKSLITKIIQFSNA